MKTSYGALQLREPEHAYSRAIDKYREYRDGYATWMAVGPSNPDSQLASLHEWLVGYSTRFDKADLVDLCKVGTGACN